MNQDKFKLINELIINRDRLDCFPTHKEKIKVTKMVLRFDIRFKILP